MGFYCRPDGTVEFIYGETLPLADLGTRRIERASHVEPAVGGWTADLAPVGGPVLGPFPTRSLALAAETAWLDRRLQEGPLHHVGRD